jgi:hypothetical protein
MIKATAANTVKSKAEERCKTDSLLFRSRQWLKRQIIREVPEDSELCEFDCRKQQCAMGEWATCDRRLRRADGELMPRSGGRDPKT